MRVLLPLVFAVAGMILSAVYGSAITPPGFDSTWVTLGAMAVALFLPMFITDKFFPPREPPSRGELEALGRLRRTDYRALRAFGVEELHDEGVHYFIELADRSVLYLCGQYLYDYEPSYGLDDAEPRQFPCSDFTVVHDHKNGATVDIDRRGDAFPLDLMAPHPRHNPLDFVDRQTIANRSYEELKARFAAEL
jgi:hypothetical protein